MIKKLINLNESDKGHVGMKAFNCSIMLKNNIKVVDGFVLYDDISKEDFQNAKKLMKDNVLYAVRSSMIDEDGFNQSLAGKYLTVLSVDKQSLRQAVLDVYKQARNCEKKAVLVQELIESEVSGVVFTVNPISGNGILINAVFGTGENMVSGSVTPDEFEFINGKITSLINLKYSIFTYGNELEIGKEVMFNKSTARVVIHNDGKLLFSISFLDRSKPVLYEDQILELINQVKKIKDIFGCEQDVEFAYSKQSFYFLQSRPITKIVSNYNENFKHLNNVVYKKAKKDNRILIGQKVSYGRYKGRVLRYTTREKIIDLNGVVLVVDEFYPELIYELNGVGAIITAKGGKLSHAAIVSREKGIPCVTGLEDNIEKLKNGDLVLVDADCGEVILYEEL